MKVLLIYPSNNEELDLFSKTSLLSNMVRPFAGLGKSNMTPPHSLLMLAAVTPPDINIHFIDERFESVNFEEYADIVGITVVTKTAPRAYLIANEFMQRGIPVVLGGIHPSVLPQEAIKHANCVVIGEGEKAWLQVLSDLKHGMLKTFYHGNKEQGNLLTYPRPLREIISHPKRYLTMKTIMATRGCENSCIFCSCGAALGKRHRTRNAKDVIKEIQDVSGKVTYFLDDNLGWNKEFLKTLLTSLIPLKTKWIGAFTLSTLNDNELLDLIKASGCIAVDIGFESVSPNTIISIRKQKTNDVDLYHQIIKQIHKRGISIYGNFILGFDNDSTDVFKELIQFIKDAAIECPMVNILMPYPGSVLYRKLEKEGRLYHRDWDFYDDSSPCVVYQPKLMSPLELVDGYLSVISSVNTFSAYLSRILLAGTATNITSTLLGLHFNLQKHSSVYNGIEKTRRSLQKIGINSKEMEGVLWPNNPQ